LKHGHARVQSKGVRFCMPSSVGGPGDDRIEGGRTSTWARHSTQRGGPATPVAGSNYLSPHRRLPASSHPSPRSRHRLHRSYPAFHFCFQSSQMFTRSLFYQVPATVGFWVLSQMPIGNGIKRKLVSRLMAAALFPPFLPSAMSFHV
jgi:hypothetical protein